MNTTKVLIYTLPTCGFCQRAKEYFKFKEIPFTSINVESDPKAQKEMIKKSGQYSVPVIDINGQIIVGFQKDAIEAMLGL